MDSSATNRAHHPSNETYDPAQDVSPRLRREQDRKTVHVSFCSMNCLLDILVTLSRIGAQLDYVSAKANSAILSVTAKPFVIRRIPKLIRELVEVTELNEL